VTPEILGAVRSRRTVALTQFEARPAASTARKRTSVSPSAEIDADEAVVLDDQVEPPFVEVWRS
jgi:hypothetical protein